LKRVVGIYAHYKFLYTGQIYELPAVIDTTYTKE
jgi:hypothetical protein